MSVLTVLLGLMSICTAIGAWHWLTDPNTSAVSFTQSLYNHPFFTMASIILGRYDHPVYKLILHLHKLQLHWKSFCSDIVYDGSA